MDNAFPIVANSKQTFRGINTNTIILFNSQEIAEAAKVATNWTTVASQIHYVGE